MSFEESLNFSLNFTIQAFFSILIFETITAHQYLNPQHNPLEIQAGL